ncbi:uncharacterized protein LOC143026847 [Oratosquilla oratoria]|uniref:uncharacterized protein LOC143026847 n=1 Tax=Oratosquilla oratoria TaxID=337810 RepID=UPI003F765D11
MSRSVYQLGITSLVVIFLLMLGHFIYKRSTESSIRGILLDDSSQMQRQNNLNPNSCKNQEDTSIDAGKPPGQRYISFFEDPCQEVPLPSLVEFFKYLNTVTIICRNKVSFGGEIQSGSLDGNKIICMDPPYGLAQVNCTIFSFGINNEWSFDDAMDHKGCKVYAFDPTMGKESHYRTPNIRFFNIGVGGEDVTMNNEWKFTYCGVSSVPATKAGGLDSISVKCKWTIARQIFILPKPSGQRLTSEMRCSSSVMTYKNIVKLTSTENSPIDYLKMDIETSEIPFFEESLYNSSRLLKRVKQLGVEIHPDRGAMKRLYTTLSYQMSKPADSTLDDDDDDPDDI